MPVTLIGTCALDWTLFSRGGHVMALGTRCQHAWHVSERLIWIGQSGEASEGVAGTDTGQTGCLSPLLASFLLIPDFSHAVYHELWW